MIDFDGLMSAVIHDTFGVTATITPVTSASAAEVTVVDKTAGIALPAMGNALGDLETVVPAARVRVTALTEAGLTRRDLSRAALEMNGRTYRIESTRPWTPPSGEDTGELWLILTETA